MTEPTNELLIRASSLPNYPDCPRRSAAKMFRKEIKAAGYDLRTLDSSIGAAIGTAVHEGAGLVLTEKAKSGELAPLDAANDAAVEKLRVRIKEEGALFDRETPSVNDGEKQALGMVKAYYHFIAPKVQPVAVETRLEASVPFSKLGFVLSGQQDVLAREPGRIRDLKTGKSRGNYKPQLGAYALLAKSHPEVLGGVEVTGAVEDYVQRVSYKKDQPLPATYPHDLKGAEVAAVAVLRMIEDDLTIFREGDPARYVQPGDAWAFPANPSSKLCSEKWCPAWGTKFCAEFMTKDTEE